jgi:stearoyl-CoA desaturase (delta-9 desaturase)
MLCAVIAAFPTTAAGRHDDIVLPERLPFALVHAACLAALWTGVTREALAIGAALYVARMLGVTAGYHRYFSHRSFKTSRAFQFVLAWLAQTSGQKSVLWWAAIHRHHHRHSDTEDDVHSPRQRGILYAHVGWIFDARHRTPTLRTVPDFAKYPELRFLDRYPLLPACLLAVLTFAAAGAPGLVVGFFWSTVALYHGTFAINSLAHVSGTRRFDTRDDSRNNLPLALITLGEGWHNNHHACPRAARQGFRWCEPDPTWWFLAVLARCGLVWDLAAAPEALRRNEPLRTDGLRDRIGRLQGAPRDRSSAGAGVGLRST